MSVLDTIRNEIGAAFSDAALFFSAATLARVTVTDGGGWTEPTETTATHGCMALITSYNDHLRAVADIPGTDAKCLIVGTSITVDPEKGDTVTVGGKAWGVIDVKIDPAKAMWVCQVRPVG